MRNVTKVLALSAISFTFVGCNVSKTQDTKLPDVDVNATGGQLPQYNVQGPNVTVGSENKTVEVPTVHVTPPKDKK